MGVSAKGGVQNGRPQAFMVVGELYMTSPQPLVSWHKPLVGDVLGVDGIKLCLLCLPLFLLMPCIVVVDVHSAVVRQDRCKLGLAPMLRRLQVGNQLPRLMPLN
jgi:hypothetical protein